MSEETVINPEGLDPCRFCETTGAIVLNRSSAKRSVYQGLCQKCGAHGPFADTRELAIAAWNRRASKAPKAEPVPWMVVSHDGRSSHIAPSKPKPKDEWTTELLGHDWTVRPLYDGAPPSPTANTTWATEELSEVYYRARLRSLGKEHIFDGSAQLSPTEIAGIEAVANFVRNRIERLMPQEEP